MQLRILHRATRHARRVWWGQLSVRSGTSGSLPLPLYAMNGKENNRPVLLNTVPPSNWKSRQIKVAQKSNKRFHSHETQTGPEQTVAQTMLDDGVRIYTISHTDARQREHGPVLSPWTERARKDASFSTSERGSRFIFPFDRAIWYANRGWGVMCARGKKWEQEKKKSVSLLLSILSFSCGPYALFFAVVCYYVWIL